MTIIVKSIRRYGGCGGAYRDDFKDIINNISGGSLNITQITIVDVGVGVDDTIDFLQFSYDVVTKGGVRQPFTGNKYGSGVGVAQLYNNEQIKEIKGRFGQYGTYSRTIKYIEFQTSSRSLTFGQVNVSDIEFTLPVGVIFGNTGLRVDSLGAYEISEVTETVPTTATATTITSTPSIVTSQNICYPSSPLAVGLSASTSILGLCFLATLGIHLWYKSRSNIIPRGNIIPTPGSQS